MPPEPSPLATSTRRQSSRSPGAAAAGTGDRSGQSGTESTAPAEFGPGRKLRLLFLFAGSFLFRFANRQLRGLSFRPPPRFTRCMAY